MKKHNNFTRDLNSELFGRRFEFDFIVDSILPTSRYHEITNALPPLFSCCMKAEELKRVQYGVGVETCEIFTLL